MESRGRIKMRKKYRTRSTVIKIALMSAILVSTLLIPSFTSVLAKPPEGRGPKKPHTIADIDLAGENANIVGLVTGASCTFSGDLLTFARANYDGGHVPPFELTFYPISTELVDFWIGTSSGVPKDFSGPHPGSDFQMDLNWNRESDGGEIEFYFWFEERHGIEGSGTFTYADGTYAVVLDSAQILRHRGVNGKPSLRYELCWDVSTKDPDWVEFQFTVSTS
jgi:hypothetical protein